MTVLYDDFAGSGALSANWTQWPSAGMTRISDKAGYSGSNSNSATVFRNDATFTGDQYAQVTVATLPGAEWSAGPCIRTDGSTYGYVVSIKAAAVRLSIVTGVYIDQVTTTVNVGSVVKVTAVTVATVMTVTVYVDGVAVLTYVPPTPSTATRVGMGCYYGDTTYRIDNWEGGDLSAGTPSLVVSDGAHAHATDNLTLTTIGTLSVADTAHAHTADSITLTATSNGTITIPAVRDWGTKALKVSETGVQVDIRNITTGALVVRKTGQTTHVTTGVCVVTDVAIVAGTTYEVVTRFADGSLGMWDYTAS